MVKKEYKTFTDPLKEGKPSLSSAASSSSPGFCKKYKGVRMRRWGSWVSEIRAPNQKTRIWLGSYSTAEAAARAYDAAMLCLKGSSANLNFPISATHYIPQESVLSPKSIQRAAAAAANDITQMSSSTDPDPTLSSSSPSDQTDDDASVMSMNALAIMKSSWYSLEGLQSPKYMDPMLGGSFFDPTVFSDDLYEEEESHFTLWNFC